MPKDISYYQQQIERIKQIKRKKDIASGRIPAPVIGFDNSLNIVRDQSHLPNRSGWGSPNDSFIFRKSTGSIVANKVFNTGLELTGAPTGGGWTSTPFPSASAGDMTYEQYLARRSGGPKRNPVSLLNWSDDGVPSTRPDKKGPSRIDVENTTRTKRQKRQERKRKKINRNMGGRRNRKPAKVHLGGGGVPHSQKFNFNTFDDLFKGGVSAKAKFGVGLGALALAGGAGMLLKNASFGLSQNNPVALSHQMKPEDVAASTFWQRQAAVAGAGYLNARMGGDTGMAGAIGTYAKGRVMDGYNVMFNSPLNDGGISPGTKYGAMAGGTMSVMAASAIKGFSKGGFKGKSGMIGGVAGILGAGIVGAGIGGYQGSKVDIGLSRAIQTARKNILGQGRRMSNRAHTMGRGYRMWASPKGRRRMGQPGHLGMDGSMAFAMHNARNRSTV